MALEIDRWGGTGKAWWPNMTGCAYRATELLEAVMAGPLYRARAADHLIVSHHYSTMGTFCATCAYPLAKDGVMVATLERSSHNPNVNLVSPYYHDPTTSADCVPEAVRNVSFFYGGGVDGHRPGYRMRRRLFRARARLPPATVLVATGPVWANDSAFESLPACGDLATATCAQCEGAYTNADVMPRAEFTISPRGDSPSTSRLTDAMQYCSIPLFVSDEQFTARPHPTPSISERMSLSATPRPALRVFLPPRHERS